LTSRRVLDSSSPIERGEYLREHASASRRGDRAHSPIPRNTLALLAATYSGRFDMGGLPCRGQHYNNKMNHPPPSRITTAGPAIAARPALCMRGVDCHRRLRRCWYLHGDLKRSQHPRGMAHSRPQLDHAVRAFLDEVSDRGLSDQSCSSLPAKWGGTPTNGRSQRRRSDQLWRHGTLDYITPTGLSEAAPSRWPDYRQPYRTAIRANMSLYSGQSCATILATVSTPVRRESSRTALPAEIGKLFSTEANCKLL